MKVEPNEKREIESFDFFLQIKISEERRVEFLNDVFDEFSNSDYKGVPVIIYNDWKEFLRVANIFGS